MGMAYYVGYYGTSLLILVGYLAIVFFLLKRIAKQLPKIKVPNWQRNPKSISNPCLLQSSNQQTTTGKPVYVIKFYYAPETYSPEKTQAEAITGQVKPFLPEGGKGTIINAAVVAPGKPYPDEAGVEVVYDRGSYRMKN